MDKFPEWARSMTPEERAARKMNENVAGVVLDPNAVYPLWLEKLGYPVDKPTQGQLEVARVCATIFLKRLGRLLSFVGDTVPEGPGREAVLGAPGIVDPSKYLGRDFALWIVWSKDSRWALANFKADAPVVGRDLAGAVPHAANAEYERLRREGKVEL